MSTTQELEIHVQRLRRLYRTLCAATQHDSSPCELCGLRENQNPDEDWPGPMPIELVAEQDERNPIWEAALTEVGFNTQPGQNH